MRIFDTPELFGEGCGSSTDGEIHCDICDHTYNAGCNDENGYENSTSVINTTFGGLTVCECCFEEIEQEVLHRMPSILQWYKQILQMRETNLTSAKRAVADILNLEP